MAKITGIEQQKKDKTRCSVYLDGAFYCGLKIEVAVKYRLKPGDEIEKSRLDEIQFENEKLQAVEKAMNHLSATIKTRRQMSDFLSSKGYTGQVIDYAIQKLESYGYIDDAAYCRAYINSVSGKGKAAIRAALISRGADRAAIDAALEEVEEDGGQALELARKYMRGKEFTRVNVNKAARYLMSRGYAYDLVKSVIAELTEDSGDEFD